ncbi:TPA: hypothetical protein QCH64_002735 [Enterobacter asburiae]|uniref:hypothetical protein n=1 Tax=Enterobacter asburiae TaxID=61645 RepID=UPI001A1BCD29|nr:hypothetical protein [Enterobacter asburiae]MCS0625303.1 hypothetical protein [Enterobacter asburiae]HAT7488642.1 hypothetical protein [Enterobacter asburiae]HAT7510202.1 hypothetical protein [Enterobacter asburiae]HDR2364438.1 hypothetical protein [Enterobacter asburiae]
MIQIQHTHVYIKSMSTVHPRVEAIELNGKVIGYTSENRDWNKSEKPISLISPEGQCIGDFCCISHAATHIASKELGVTFDETEVLKDGMPFGSDFLDALAFALATGALKGKRPH